MCFPLGVFFGPSFYRSVKLILTKTVSNMLAGKLAELLRDKIVDKEEKSGLQSYRPQMRWSVFVLITIPKLDLPVICRHLEKATFA